MQSKQSVGHPPLRIGVLGSGKGSNFEAVADAIRTGKLHATVVCVISDVADALILAKAARLGIPALHLSGEPYRTKLDGEAEGRYIAALRQHGAEVVALAGFMRMLKPALLSAYRGRVLNIHPSLLPAFPGLESWRQALDYGAKVTGCTVHFVDQGMDTGAIIVQRTVPVLDDDTPASLHARIQVEEHIAYPAALQLLAEGKLRMEGRHVRVTA